MKEDPRRIFGLQIIVFIAYFATAKLGLSLDAVSGFATLVWPPTGIALAAILLFGYQMIPAIVLAAFAANFSGGAPLFVALGIATGNSLEAFIGAYLLKRFRRFQSSLERLKDVLALMIYAAFLSTLASATIGVSSLLLGHVVVQDAYVSTWRAWWVGDVLGDLVIASFLLVWLAKPIKFTLKRSHTIEGIILMMVVVGVSLVIFTNFLPPYVGFYALPSLIFPVITWAAMRFGPRGATLSVVITSLIAVWGSTHGGGPFVQASLSQTLTLLQIFMGAAAITGLIVGAIDSEREQEGEEILTLNRSLQESNALLQQRAQEQEEARNALLNVLEDLQVAKTAIEEEEIEDEALLNSIGEGFIATSKDGAIIKMNPQAKIMLGRESNGVVGKPLSGIIRLEDESGDAIPEHTRPLTRALVSGEKVTTGTANTYYYVRRDGTRFPVAITVNPFKVGGVVKGTIEVFRDITKEKEVDRAKSEFVTLASHQLRTPLTVIKWVTERFVKTERLTEKGKVYINDIHSAAHNLAELVELFLNISRIEEGAIAIVPQHIEVVDYIKNYLEECRPMVDKKKLSLRFQEHPPTLEIISDPNALRNIIQSIVSNAIEYTGEGGSIEVRLVQKQDTILLSVSDNGIGIPNEDKPRIFQEFMRGANAKLFKTDGTGLGLYIASKAVKLLGGTIRFESEEGQGTTFYVALPARSAPVSGEKTFV